ncbi:MAG: 2-phospho-L-lactate transferase [Sphingomonadales bacterium]|nr:2-phospho-L-lactate transferase [Sphingomonadales bacterium]
MKVTVLTGGVGGAKLVLGLSRVSPALDVTAIVNTGDDFTHLGLRISPDIDTLLYTLSGKANVAQGWGREGESWRFMAALHELGGEEWFQLGDGDMALHVLRTARLSAGETLTAIIGDFARQWGIAARVLPMTDDIVATKLESDEGRLDFQQYFVARRCAPVVHRIEFEGAATAHPASGVVGAVTAAELVIVAPSNPFLSIDPILAVPGIAAALRDTTAPVIAVSPIVAGQSVKGPTAKLMQELGLELGNAAIANHYKGLIDGLIIDTQDDAADGIAILRADTMMRDDNDKIRVARAVLALADQIAASRTGA